MQGRRPKSKNVIPLRPDIAIPGSESEDARKAAIEAMIGRMRPKGLRPELRAEFNRVAAILADPIVDRLKPRYIDVVLEYCRVTVRLKRLREKMPTIDEEIYAVSGRNGRQLRPNPHVGQMNEAWRQWRSLVAMLGLSPADERNMLPGQGDLFDDAERYFG